MLLWSRKGQLEIIDVKKNKTNGSDPVSSTLFFPPCFRLVRRKQIEGSKGHTRGVMGSDGERRHCQKKYKKKRK